MFSTVKAFLKYLQYKLLKKCAKNFGRWGLIKKRKIDKLVKFKKSN